jgi:hypothetical protein
MPSHIYCDPALKMEGLSEGLAIFYPHTCYRYDCQIDVAEMITIIIITIIIIIIIARFQSGDQVCISM